jgi:hypothetical protein
VSLECSSVCVRHAGEEGFIRLYIGQMTPDTELAAVYSLIVL